METLAGNFEENVRWLNETLGVGRSCDIVSRDYIIGGRRARLWVVDGFGLDATLERMGAFWLTLTVEKVAGITRMQAFLDRFVTFTECAAEERRESIVIAVLLGKSCF